MTGSSGTLDIGAQKHRGPRQSVLACAKNAEQIKKADVPFVLADPGDGAARSSKGRPQSKRAIVESVNRSMPSDRSSTYGVTASRILIARAKAGYLLVPSSASASLSAASGSVSTWHMSKRPVSMPFVHDALDELEDPLGPHPRP